MKKPKSIVDAAIKSGRLEIIDLRPPAPMTSKCGECGRVFDLLDETDAEELTWGHDCEVMPDPAPEPPRAHASQVMFTTTGETVNVAARTERDSADRHAVNGDLFAWGDSQ